MLMNELLADVDEMICPAGVGPDHGAHLYVIRLDTDKVGFSTPDFVGHLKDKYRVGTAKHYPPVWSWEAFANLGYTGEGCPIAAKACEQVVSLPIFPHTTPEDCAYLARAIRQTLSDLEQ